MRQTLCPPKSILGIDAALLSQHIAWDIGVAGVARYLVELSDCAAFLATHSRLVVDLNRYPEDASAIPASSDGVEIGGNVLSDEQRQQRLDAYFHPYHTRLEQLLQTARPALILSIHSFTPRLETDPDGRRPWEIGILYNDHEAASSIAIDYLQGEGVIVGDQLPYSGKQLNATMNRHAEAERHPLCRDRNSARFDRRRGGPRKICCIIGRNGAIYRRKPCVWCHDMNRGAGKLL